MNYPPRTPQEYLDFYFLVRNVRWRYKLDQVEEAIAERVSRLLADARKEVYGHMLRLDPETFTGARVNQLLAEIDVYTAAMREDAGAVIGRTAGAIGAWSLTEQSDIISLGGRAAGITGLSMDAARFSALFSDQQLGGRLLAEWVDSAFDHGLKGRIKDAIDTGLFMGEGYPKLLRRALREGEQVSRRDALTLVKTYVQSASAAAREAVYARNDVVEKVEWSAVMESSYSKTGHGTCVRCQALDGQRFPKKGPRPEIPLHPACRCMYLPVTDWTRLGMPELDLIETTRPYAIREDKAIGAGGKRELLGTGEAAGSYADWYKTRDRAFQVNAVGPTRQRLIAEGLPFRDLVDRKTGRLRKITELERILER